MGQEIEDISLEIKNGEVVKGTAAKGQDLLNKILDVPGARRFGEAAIGNNERANINLQKICCSMKRWAAQFIWRLALRIRKPAV
jgi:leucyl aminopeptidase (aminopeptidase T)